MVDCNSIENGNSDGVLRNTSDGYTTTMLSWNQEKKKIKKNILIFTEIVCTTNI